MKWFERWFGDHDDSTEATDTKDKGNHSIWGPPTKPNDPKAVDPDDDQVGGKGDDDRGWFRAVRWLRAPMLGNPDLPTRATWIAVFAACQTAMSWIGGRVW